PPTDRAKRRGSQPKRFACRDETPGEPSSSAAPARRHETQRLKRGGPPTKPPRRGPSAPPPRRAPPAPAPPPGGGGRGRPRAGAELVVGHRQALPRELDIVLGIGARP